MMEDSATLYRATRVQSIAKYLERIADHAMNLAETVVFLVKGNDIRHYNRKQDSDAPAAPRRIRHRQALESERDGERGVYREKRGEAQEVGSRRRNSSSDLPAFPPSC